ncbi:MAG: NADH-quinone oxidoreductase subunit M [Fimbriimonadaceae bacterium]|nr:NADH-quinone oxidoreductase subunit M [Fimbriimonadaceae bacterium]
MQPTGLGLLSLIVFTPLMGALLLMLIPKEQEKLHRYAALGVSVLTFAFSLMLLKEFNGQTFHFQMEEFIPWIKPLGIHYHLGMDGISYWLVLLTTFLTAISIWFSFYVSKRVKLYFICLLILETAMLGVFVSLDMILFYTFFEASLVPMWLLIGIWGGERRTYAGTKFFIYTFAGSIFMLIGIIALANLYGQATNGPISFSIVDIQAAVANGSLWAKAMTLQPWIFWSFAIAFLVKCPAFPFHTWLPDAHVEAPTAGSIILAGVLLKMGTYGFLRFCLPLFPDTIASQVPIIMTLAVIGIIYGAIVAAVQPDWKKLVAYSSVAHMGFVLLGIFSLTHTGLLGGSLQQLNHGISTGALFLLIGLVYERRHTRMFKNFGGLKAQMPIYSAIFLIVMLSSVGLPGTNGFIGEFMAMMGAFEAAYAGAYGLNLGFIVVAGFGVVLAAVYLLYMFQQVFYGKNDNPDNRRLKDIKPWEMAMCGLLLVFVFWGGLYPKTFLQPMEASIGAVRMMAINPVGQRPAWNEKGQEIDADMNLVADGVVIAPAKLHFPLKPPVEENQPEVQVKARFSQDQVIARR